MSDTLTADPRTLPRLGLVLRRPVHGPRPGEPRHLGARSDAGLEEGAEHIPDLLPDLRLHPGCGSVPPSTSKPVLAVLAASWCGSLLDRSLLRMSLANSSAASP